MNCFLNSVTKSVEGHNLKINAAGFRYQCNGVGKAHLEPMLRVVNGMWRINAQQAVVEGREMIRQTRRLIAYAKSNKELRRAMANEIRKVGEMVMPKMNMAVNDLQKLMREKYV